MKQYDLKRPTVSRVDFFQKPFQFRFEYFFVEQRKKRNRPTYRINALFVCGWMCVCVSERERERERERQGQSQSHILPALARLNLEVLLEKSLILRLLFGFIHWLKLKKHVTSIFLLIFDQWLSSHEKWRQRSIQLPVFDKGSCRQRNHFE